ncbi:M23 family metallopeptidase [Bacteroides sp. 224]|uniref:M23 family metallopeptidase n=1 Tax=Bacteroides sp. 224 TaxID=2302936 RepID=UPI0013D84553|nr:M23 family metallopeptidase [Bacteroides sp. 224]NDV64771.1 M23 family peptidase [Bacteroides sp. 224]
MRRRLFNKAFWHNFKFKYKISILNENTLEEVAGLRVSKLNGLSVLLTAVILIFFIAASILIFTPLRNYLPGYMNSKLRAQVVDNALKADSLKLLVDRQNLYIMNVQDVFRGIVRPDSTGTMEELTTIREDELMERTEREEAFRRQYEEAEKYNLTTINLQAEAAGLLFYTPTQGVISSQYDVDSKHFGIDIAASPNESVLSILDGVVIISAYTAETGYVIGIQHSQEFVSFYKHCGALLKQQGEQVKAGEVIALVGNTGTLTTGSHLHFELWHKEKAINPESFIVF